MPIRDKISRGYVKAGEFPWKWIAVGVGGLTAVGVVLYGVSQGWFTPKETATAVERERRTEIDPDTGEEINIVMLDWEQPIELLVEHRDNVFSIGQTWSEYIHDFNILSIPSVADHVARGYTVVRGVNVTGLHGSMFVNSDSWFGSSASHGAYISIEGDEAVRWTFGDYAKGSRHRKPLVGIVPVSVSLGTRTRFSIVAGAGAEAFVGRQSEALTKVENVSIVGIITLAEG